MPGKIIIAIGMPRAGSGWHYNLIHDLTVAAGGADARGIRQRYHLERLLTEVNCNIGTLSPQRLLPVMIPAWMGNTFAIKAHAGLTPLAARLIRAGWLRPAYIYRDPRDALLSAYEYGQRKRNSGRTGPFSDLTTLDKAIEFMRFYVQVSEQWLGCEHALHTRYEDLLANYDAETARILDFLNLEADNPALRAVCEQYRPERGSSDQRGTHFVKGKTGRYRQALSPEQQQRCLDLFGDYLEHNGYPLA